MNSNERRGPVSAQVEATAGSLLLSTIIAGLCALAILVLFWLPAEYGVDYTGVGRVTGLTQMGELKEQQHHDTNADAIGLVHILPGQAEAVDLQWRDEYQYALAPEEGIEVKLEMSKGDKVQYQWTAHGAVVYHDTHGDGNGQSISYEKGHGIPQDQGVLTAAFEGQHGWWWRNTSDEIVSVSIRVAGDYTQMLTP